MRTLAAVDHVQLAAPPGSEAEPRAYCAGTLGVKRIPKPPALAARGGRRFQAGAAQPHPGIDTDFRPTKTAHPGLRVTDVEPARPGSPSGAHR